ncbi:MAG: aminoacyl-tRNA hydrolase [Thermoleophilia bacterium]|nr:aminoacyl-tRNA hydrolase [Thermoleophilia bacterium]
MRLVVGLGNPGGRYAATRHNAGQMVVEELALRLGVTRFGEKYAGRWAETRGPGGPLALLVPTTFMNDSGRSVGPAAGSLRITPGQVLVVHDEIDLPFGVVRGKCGGGHGGHNGLRSIDQGLGSRDYARVRVGVGRPGPEFRGDDAAWVLQAFTEPRDEVLALLGAALRMVETALESGIDAAIAEHHAAPPGARAKARAERRAAAEATAAADTEGEAADVAE